MKNGKIERLKFGVEFPLRFFFGVGILCGKLKLFLGGFQVVFRDVLGVKDDDFIASGLLAVVKGSVCQIDAVVHTEALVVFGNAKSDGDVLLLASKFNFPIFSA